MVGTTANCLMREIYNVLLMADPHCFVAEKSLRGIDSSGIVAGRVKYDLVWTGKRTMAVLHVVTLTKWNHSLI